MVTFHSKRRHVTVALGAIVLHTGHVAIASFTVSANPKYPEHTHNRLSDMTNDFHLGLLPILQQIATMKKTGANSETLVLTVRVVILRNTNSKYLRWQLTTGCRDQYTTALFLCENSNSDYPETLHISINESYRQHYSRMPHINLQLEYELPSSIRFGQF